MQPMADIKHTLEGLDIEALSLDVENLLLRPSWWPSKSPGVRAAQDELDNTRARARLATGIVISHKNGGLVDSKLIIGRDEGSDAHDNRWAAMVLTELIEGNLPDPNPNAAPSTNPQEDADRLRAARLNNLGCAFLWLSEWRSAQSKYREAQKIKNPQRSVQSSSSGESAGAWWRRATRKPLAAAASGSQVWPGELADENLAVLAHAVRAQIDLLHARAEEDQLRTTLR